MLRHREWVLQRLGLANVFFQKEIFGAKLWRLSPYFVEKHSQPLTDPPMVRARDATHMLEDDVVIGIVVNGQARAYPWWIMDNHHVANDVVADQPILITLCEQCSSAVAFDPVVNGRRLTFWQPYIYNGTVALEDHQTRSVWSPYLASAIRGRLKGTQLALQPLQHMEWAAWSSLHPDTLVLPGDLGSRFGHGSKHTIGDPDIGIMASGLANWDERLPHSTLVLGVVGDRVQRAYPLESLRRRASPINDQLGALPIVILHEVGNGSYGALAFSRRMGERILTFSAGPGGARDEETESSWTVYGVAIDGPLRGRRLDFVRSHVSEWFVWAAHFPEIELADL